MDFYTSKNDSKLAEDIVSKSADLYIMEDETPDSDSGVLDKTTPSATTLTPLVSPVWGVNALTGQIVVIQDDNNNAYEFIIASNTATAITVDLTADVDDDDQSANYTTLATFSFKLWGAEQFLGYSDENTFNDEEELKEFKEGVPRKKIREDLLEKLVTLETTIRTSSPGILKAVNNLQDDSNATYFILKGGSDPATRNHYYLVAKNINVNGKNQQIRMYWCQIHSNGGRVLGGGEEYETIPAMISVNSAPLHNDQEDRYRVRIEK